MCPQLNKPFLQDLWFHYFPRQFRPVMCRQFGLILLLPPLFRHRFRSNFPWPYLKQHNKTFSMWSEVRTSNKFFFFKYAITISQNGMNFSMLSILKMLSFFLVAEALTDLIYHRPTGKFQFLVLPHGKSTTRVNRASSG